MRPKSSNSQICIDMDPNEMSCSVRNVLISIIQPQAGLFPLIKFSLSSDVFDKGTNALGTFSELRTRSFPGKSIIWERLPSYLISMIGDLFVEGIFACSWQILDHFKRKTTISCLCGQGRGSNLTNESICFVCLSSIFFAVR